MAGQIFQPVQNSSSPVNKAFNPGSSDLVFLVHLKKYLAVTSTPLIYGKPLFCSFLRLISTVKKVAYRLLVTTKLMSTLMTIGMVKVFDICNIYMPCIFALQ